MDITSEFVQLARLVNEGDKESAQALIRRTFRTIMRQRPDLVEAAKGVLESFSRNGISRSVTAQPLPVDIDSRLELLRREIIVNIDQAPVWPANIAIELNATINEHERARDLAEAGLLPTRSLLFTGPPGVGKTLAARWLAQQLSYPLLTLDLAGVMSSFLGRTGNNIKVVLDYARRIPSVLLLDEFDAIAKRRDDNAEIGELKRLVTVLLQAVDDWPASSILVAATNHSELLDPAVWRRFDRKLLFPLPNSYQIQEVVQQHLGENVTSNVLRTFSLFFEGESFAETVRAVTIARREAVLENKDISDVLIAMAAMRHKELPKAKRLQIVPLLEAEGLSQRRISEITGMARATIRSNREHLTGEK